MFEYLQIFIFPKMFYNSSLQVTLGFANITSIIVCTSKLVNNVELKKFRNRVFTSQETSSFITLASFMLKLFYINKFSMIVTF